MQNEMNTLDMWIDFSCPWSHIAYHQVAASHASHQLALRAFQLNPDLPGGGIPRPEYRANKFGSQAESDRRDDRVVTAGREVGLAIDFSQIAVTPNTRVAHRAVKAVEAREGDNAQLVETIFAAYFSEGADIGDPEVLLRIAGEVGVELTRADLAGDEFDSAIDDDIAAAHAAGLTGVPYFMEHATRRPIPAGMAIARLAAA